MPFILKEFKVIKNKTIQITLIQDLGFRPREANRLIAKGRVFDSKNNTYQISNKTYENSVFIGVFEGHTRGLQPLLVFNDFAIFDKPSNLVIHPNSKKTKYSLLDEIRYHFGNKANQAHRIDAETSGLVLVGLNEKVTKTLATMFENKQYKKSYLAIVKGKIDKEIKIDKNLKKEGKESITFIKPLKYNQKRDLTLLEITPITGRQHQIRVHLYSIGHKILGDPIYGINDEIVESYLNKTLDKKTRVLQTGSNRLWLQANFLEFKYKDNIYKIYSKNQDIFKEFNQ